LVSLLLHACAGPGPRNDVSEASADDAFPVPKIEYQPRQYVCFKALDSLVIDGDLDEESWHLSNWTEEFVDIQGDTKPAPRFSTRVKMLWDSDYFYIAAQMEEPDLWATLTQRDAVIYHDNDFEVFIDPDGDTHEYYELEINALGTEWDLLLIRPYRDGAPAVNAWDIAGLNTGISLNGSINDPSDVDSGWIVEIALPWKVLAECAHRPSPPESSDLWWVNFSRVQWHLDEVNGTYRKRMDSSGKRTLPEDNWVWSPQGLIAMHYPEMWGLVQFEDTFVGQGDVAFETPNDYEARWALRQLYYAEREYHRQHHVYTGNYELLEVQEVATHGFDWPPDLVATETKFFAVTRSLDGRYSVSIDTYGRVLTEYTDREDR